MNTYTLYALGALAIAGIGFLIYRMITKRRRKAKLAKTELMPTVNETIPQEVISKTGVINARIYDPAKRSRAYRHVELIPGKNYGRQWLCGTYRVFALKVGTGGLEPVVPPSDMGHPTSELYEALQTKDDVAEVLGNKNNESKNIKIGLLVLAAIVALFLMFMKAYKG